MQGLGLILVFAELFGSCVERRLSLFKTGLERLGRVYHWHYLHLLEFRALVAFERYLLGLQVSDPRKRLLERRISFRNSQVGIFDVLLGQLDLFKELGDEPMSNRRVPESANCCPVA